jgi:transcriptional regulator with XRE-family HTH domain
VLAAKADVSEILVEKIEARARTPSRGTLERLARALGCRVQPTLVPRRGK